MSREEIPQKSFLKLYAYSTLANFMVSLGSQSEVDEEDARAMLRLQNDLIQHFDATLATELDQASLQAFREFVRKYRVRID